MPRSLCPGEIVARRILWNLWKTGIATLFPVELVENGGGVAGFLPLPSWTVVMIPKLHEWVRLQSGLV